MSVLTDSLLFRSDTAVVHAEVSGAGPSGDFKSRRGIAFWSPRRVAVVRLISRRSHDPDASDGDGLLTNMR